MSKRHKRKKRAAANDPARSFAYVQYNGLRSEDLWARIVFHDSKNEECGRTRPFVIQKGYHYPDFKQGVHGSIWTKIRRALTLIDEYYRKRTRVTNVMSTIDSSCRSTQNVHLARRRGVTSVVSYDDAGVKDVILDQELFAEKTLLLLGIYTRTIFEQLPKKGLVKIPLRDDDLQIVRNQHITLQSLSNIVAHHRSPFFDGEVLRDLFSADDTLWFSDSDNETSLGVLFQDYLDCVSEVLRNIRISDLTGLIGGWMGRLSKLKDHEMINLLQELHCLGKLVSDSDYGSTRNHENLVEHWFRADMNVMFRELQPTLILHRFSLQQAQHTHIKFGFRHFHFEPELAKSQIRIDGKLYLYTPDASFKPKLQRTRDVRTSFDFAPFLRSVAKFSGDERLCDLHT